MWLPSHAISVSLSLLPQCAAALAVSTATYVRHVTWESAAKRSPLTRCIREPISCRCIGYYHIRRVFHIQEARGWGRLLQLSLVGCDLWIAMRDSASLSHRVRRELMSSIWSRHAKRKGEREREERSGAQSHRGADSSTQIAQSLHAVGTHLAGARDGVIREGLRTSSPDQAYPSLRHRAVSNPPTPQHAACHTLARLPPPAGLPPSCARPPWESGLSWGCCQGSVRDCCLL